MDVEVHSLGPWRPRRVWSFPTNSQTYTHFVCAFYGFSMLAKHGKKLDFGLVVVIVLSQS